MGDLMSPAQEHPECRYCVPNSAVPPVVSWTGPRRNSPSRRRSRAVPFVTSSLAESTTDQLAAENRLPIALENGRHHLHPTTAAQVVAALERGGVLLIPSDEAGPGVRLRRPIA